MWRRNGKNQTSCKEMKAPTTQSGPFLNVKSNAFLLSVHFYDIIIICMLPLKEGIEMGARILNICDVKGRLRQEAFDWSLSEQQRMEVPVRAIRLTIDDERCKNDTNDCIRSIFIDGKTGTTFLRCDWPKTGRVRYYDLVNFYVLRYNCPKLIERLIENGIKLYRFYDGPHGGITRPTSKKFNFA